MGTEFEVGMEKWCLWCTIRYGCSGVRTYVSLEAGDGGLSLTVIAAQGVRYGMSSQDFT